MSDEAQHIALGDIGRLMAEIDELKFERDSLRAEVAKLEADRESWKIARQAVGVKLAEVEIERDAAYVRGLERAKEIVVGWSWLKCEFAIRDDIITEIDKAKA